MVSLYPVMTWEFKNLGGEKSLVLEEIELWGICVGKVRGFAPGIFSFGFALGFGTGGVHFEVREDVFGAVDDSGWESSEASDLDAVGLIGGTGEDFA